MTAPRVMRGRSLAVVAGTALLALTGAGCKSVVHAGAAATVGDHRISVSTLQKATDDLYQGPGAQSFTRAQVQQIALNNIIQKSVIARVAADLGISPPPSGTVDQAIASLEGQLGGEGALIQAAAQQQILLSPSTIHDFFSQQLLQEAVASTLIRRTPPSEAELHQLYQSDGATYQSEHSADILVKTEALASQIKAQLDADPSKFAGLAKQYSIDAATKDNGGDQGTQPRGNLDSSLEDAVFAAKPGTIIGPIQGQLGYYVAKVFAVTSIPYAKARAAILQRVETLQEDPTYGQKLVLDELVRASNALDIHVNARFGSWSAANAAVGPDLGALSTPASTAPAAPTGTAGS